VADHDLNRPDGRAGADEGGRRVVAQGVKPEARDAGPLARALPGPVRGVGRLVPAARVGEHGVTLARARGGQAMRAQGTGQVARERDESAAGPRLGAALPVGADGALHPQPAALGVQIAPPKPDDLAATQARLGGQAEGQAPRPIGCGDDGLDLSGRGPRALGVLGARRLHAGRRVGG
jgi:hypothetical protein